MVSGGYSRVNKRQPRAEAQTRKDNTEVSSFSLGQDLGHPVTRVPIMTRPGTVGLLPGHSYYPKPYGLRAQRVNVIIDAPT